VIVFGVTLLTVVVVIGTILLVRPHLPPLVSTPQTDGDMLPKWAGSLVPGEQIEYADRPGAELLLTRIWPDIVVVGILLGVVFVAGSTGVQWAAIAGLVVVILDVLLQMKLWSCTRYILTNLRAVRIDGWWNRDVEWLSWKKVTEVSLRKQWANFRFQIVTIEIHTAHTTSSFRAMRDIEDPDEFAAQLAELALRSGGTG
jgi:hypothetical protein